MRSNVQNTTLHDNIRNIDNNLTSLEKALKDMVKISIKEIIDDPTKEKELISLWANHANNISDFFLRKCEKAGNKSLYKNIVKHIMFNK